MKESSYMLIHDKCGGMVLVDKHWLDKNSVLGTCKVCKKGMFPPEEKTVALEVFIGTSYEVDLTIRKSNEWNQGRIFV